MEEIKDYSITCGLVPSLKDYRDISVSAILPQKQIIPEEFLFNKPLPYINQTIYPDCVACTGATMESAVQQILGNPEIAFDWQWLYAQCKLIDGLPAGTQGTTFKAMLSVLKNIGCKPMNCDPNDLNTIAKYKIAGYVQANTDLQSLKTAIFNFGVILMGFTGSNQGWQTEIVRAPLPGESIWNHATSGKGYKIDPIIAQNSWGKEWGDNGDFYAGKEYPPFEAWAILEKLPDNWESLLPQVKDKPIYKFIDQMGYMETAPDVIQLQNCLKWNGCMSKEVPSTGYYGQLTLAAVKLYQTRNGITPTGIVGPITLSSLNRDFSS